MKIAIVSLSEVLKHPKNRLDAGYWVGKANEEKAYNKKEGGLLEEDDVNGKIMLPKSEADLYNETKNSINKLTDNISHITEVINQ
jgi:hypothetical protein